MARRRRVAALLSVLLALVLAACSSSDAGHVTQPGAATEPSSNGSTTTTTTLPVAVPRTRILRARVAALPPGADVEPSPSPASPAWVAMVPIAYRTLGHGPDLLLIPGQDASMSWWEPKLLSDLAGHYRVTIFDLPGTGYSGAATAPLSMRWLADMTAGLALTVGLDHPVVLGWGLGGEIAMSLAERHPGFASSLVLVDTSAGGAVAPGPTRGVAALLAQPGATPLELSTLLFPTTGAGMLERVLWRNRLFAGTTDWLTESAVIAEAALEAAFWKSSPVITGLSGVTSKTLVVSGTDDTVFPPDNADLLAGELPHVTLLMLPGAGYGAITQDEPAFVTALELFTG